MQFNARQCWSCGIESDQIIVTHDWHSVQVVSMVPHVKYLCLHFVVGYILFGLLQGHPRPWLEEDQAIWQIVLPFSLEPCHECCHRVWTHRVNPMCGQHL